LQIHELLFLGGKNVFVFDKSPRVVPSEIQNRKIKKERKLNKQTNKQTKQTNVTSFKILGYSEVCPNET